MARFKPGVSVEEMRAGTEDARRIARFKAAEDRIRRIVDGAPPLTETQKAKLAILLLAPGGDDRAAG